MKRLMLLCLPILLASCIAKETDNPEKAYKYWSGSEAPKQIKLIKGRYYQSPHFTLEYEFFLKFKSDKEWFENFVSHNKLEIDTLNQDWSKFTVLPSWFKPDKHSIIYTRNQKDAFERSRYMINPANGICYIYETLGM